MRVMRAPDATGVYSRQQLHNFKFALRHAELRSGRYHEALP